MLSGLCPACFGELLKPVGLPAGFFVFGTGKLS